jgi:hypothetical protein
MKLKGTAPVADSGDIYPPHWQQHNNNNNNNNNNGFNCISIIVTE